MIVRPGTKTSIGLLLLSRKGWCLQELPPSRDKGNTLLPPVDAHITALLIALMKQRDSSKATGVQTTGKKFRYAGKSQRQRRLISWLFHGRFNDEGLRVRVEQNRQNEHYNCVKQKSFDFSQNSTQKIMLITARSTSGYYHTGQRIV